jgi:hypothetical protein
MSHRLSGPVGRRYPDGSMGRHWLSGLMLVLAASGLFLMHGPDAAGHDGLHHGSERSETTMPHQDVASSSMSVFQPGETSTAGLGAEASAAQGWSQAVALCMAVLAVGVTALVRRLLPRGRARLERVVPAPTTWRVRRPGTARPPGRSHLELCVQLC